MKLSIFGSSAIIAHHIEAAKKNSFEIFAIYSSNKKSKNIKILAKKFKIKKIYYDWNILVNDSFKNNCSILIAGRIKDNKKILRSCLKYNLKIIIEKPVFTKSDEFKEFLKFNKNIFVGYNRVYYDIIFRLKKIFLKKAPYSIYIKCPEINKKNIELNASHIISILYYLCGRITLLKKIKNKNSIFCIFRSSENIPIFLNINLNSPDNFSIEFNFKKTRITLNPIEKLTVYDRLDKIKYKNTNIYKPHISKIINEYKLSDLKPGFDNQYKNFKKFIKNKKNKRVNIRDSREIISICNLISK